MINYIFRRLIGIIPLLFGITIISFAVIHLAPGKPANIEQSLNPKISQDVRLRLEKLYGLDKPLHAQYLAWAGKLLRCDFGRSFGDGRPVMEKITERLPVTLGIHIASLALMFLIGIPAGVFSATRQDSRADRALTVVSFIAFAMPGFWLALLLMNLLCVQFRVFPVSGLTSLDFEYYSWWRKALDAAWHCALPVAVSSLGGIAGVMRYMRSSMIEALARPYIYTARAKGLPRRLVVYKHALRNALIPIVTIIGLSVGGLLGGSVIFESLFALPGVGSLFYEAVMTRDYPLIMAEVVLGGVLTMIGNLIADIGYAWVDPRIRYRH